MPSKSKTTVTILEYQGFDAICKKLMETDLTFSVSKSAKVNDLDHHSSKQVLIVPVKALATKTWLSLRVRLAQSWRSYIVVGSQMPSQDIVNAIHDGAHDVLETEDSNERWQQSIEHAAFAQTSRLDLYGMKKDLNTELLIGRSSMMNALRENIRRIGPTKANVLIMGDSGAGKEKVAQSLHETTNKMGDNFIALNCAAIPKDLLESELFGVVKGAFTGAMKDRPGLVEQANGGTLFLDEIGEMDISVQPKLLRFLETRKARRVGSEKEYSVSLRIVSAPKGAFVDLSPTWHKHNPLRTLFELH